MSSIMTLLTSGKIIQLNEYGCRDAPCKKYYAILQICEIPLALSQDNKITGYRNRHQD